MNRQRLLEAIRRLGPISRADLSKRTHLSPPTVSALVEELVGGAGLLREVGIGASSGGRPPILLEFNADFGCLAGIDVGAHLVRFVLADLQGRVLARDEQRTRTEAPEATTDQVLHGIEGLFRRSGRDIRKLLAIGIAAPGITDVTTGRIISAPSLPNWKNVPLQEIVQAKFDAPVHVDNDANMAALGERWQGVARGIDDFVFVALGAGVGAGIVIGGRLHRGHHWYAGQIGRMTLDSREWQSDFGGAGYLATHAGASAIRDLPQAQAVVAQAAVDGRSAVQAIVAAARAGDRDAAAVVEHLGVLLGNAVANLVAVLDPAVVVFGGGLSHAGPLFLEPVQRVVTRIVPNVPAIALSGLGDDAPLLGAVSSAMEAAEARLFAIAGSPGVSAESASLAAAGVG